MRAKGTRAGLSADGGDAGMASEAEREEVGWRGKRPRKQ